MKLKISDQQLLSQLGHHKLHLERTIAVANYLFLLRCTDTEEKAIRKKITA